MKTEKQTNELSIKMDKVCKSNFIKIKKKKFEYNIKNLHGYTIVIKCCMQLTNLYQLAVLGHVQCFGRSYQYIILSTLTNSRTVHSWTM